MLSRRAAATVAIAVAVAGLAWVTATSLDETGAKGPSSGEVPGLGTAGDGSVLVGGLPAPRIGDSLTYSTRDRSGPVRVDVTGRQAVLGGDARMHDAVQVRYRTTEGPGPRYYVQALDPETGRLLRTVNRCQHLEEADDGDPQCDQDRALVRFDGWGLPGLLGVPPLVGNRPGLQGGMNLTVPVPGSPTITYERADGKTKRTTGRLELSVSSADFEDAENPFYGGPANGTVTLDGAPYPEKVRSSSYISLERVALRRGNGSRIPFNGTDTLEPTKRLVPFGGFVHPGVPFSGPVSGSILSPSQALEEAKETMAYQAFREDHPNASVVAGDLDPPHNDTDNAGFTNETIQGWGFTWAEPGDDTGLSVEVTRRIRSVEGRRYNNTTRTESERVRVTPAPHDASTRGAPLDTVLQVIPNRTELGEVHQVAWTTFPDSRPGAGASHVVGLVGFDPPRENQSGFSLRKTPSLTLSVEVGTLRAVSAPWEEVRRLDDEGFGWTWPRP